MTANIRELEKQVHAEASHLGWKRLDVSPEAKKWQFLDTAIDLLGITESFLGFLDLKYHSQSIRLLRAATSLLKERFETTKRVRLQPLPDMFRHLIPPIS